ncbi:MAG: DUF2726 domain-containing protein [Planctomycetes bacterium]|nr:DUF2726 domain-containing protein [Planctomycetota bacterium]
MLDIIAQITISEVMLLFVLLFVLPTTTFLILRLRRYENLFGELPNTVGKKKAKPPEQPKTAPLAVGATAVPTDVFPYKIRAFLSSADKACLQAMREALGPDVEVFPKVALWETIESADKNPGYLERLHGKDYDFLVCDRKTGQPLTAVMFKPGRGRPTGAVDELKRICAAAKANVVFIDMLENYDAKMLKDALGIPDLNK